MNKFFVTALISAVFIVPAFAEPETPDPSASGGGSAESAVEVEAALPPTAEPSGDPADAGADSPTDAEASADIDLSDESDEAGEAAYADIEPSSDETVSVDIDDTADIEASDEPEDAPIIETASAPQKTVPCVGVSVGVEGGYSYNMLNTGAGYRAFTAYKDRGGFLIGVPVLVSFGDKFAVGSGVRYIQKNYTYERDFLDDSPVRYADYTNGFLQVPIFAEFSVNFSKARIFFDLGATLGGWLHSDRKGMWLGISANPFDPSSLWEEFDESVAFDKERDNRFEAALFAGFGVGYTIGNFTPYISAQYHYGLTDLQKDYMTGRIPRYNNTVTAAAGVMFDVTRNNIRGGK